MYRQSAPDQSAAVAPVLSADRMAAIAWRLGWPSAIELQLNPARQVELSKPPPRPFTMAPADDATWRALETAQLARRTGLSQGAKTEWTLTPAGARAVWVAVLEVAFQLGGQEPAR